MNNEGTTIKPMDEKYSHLIYFYSDTEEASKNIISKLKETFDIELYEAKKTKSKNYKTKIAVHAEDVCNLACELTALKKNIYVYDWEKLKESTEKTKAERKRFYRDFRYLCSVLCDDEGKDIESIKEMIKNKSIFENAIIKNTYDSIIEFIPESDIDNIAYSILNKLNPTN